MQDGIYPYVRFYKSNRFEIVRFSYHAEKAITIRKLLFTLQCHLPFLFDRNEIIPKIESRYETGCESQSSGLWSLIEERWNSRNHSICPESMYHTYKLVIHSIQDKPIFDKDQYLSLKQDRLCDRVLPKNGL